MDAVREGLKIRASIHRANTLKHIRNKVKGIRRICLKYGHCRMRCPFKFNIVLVEKLI